MSSSAALIKRPDTSRKLEILTESARYDVSCASSGSTGQLANSRIGNVVSSGICHSWAADGRCISLLKVLLSNSCVYDCAYCLNRRSNDIPRATFSVEELVDITLNFYRRNYIEGLFLSSAVWRNVDRTMESLTRIVEELRFRHGFGGYIHLKAIPGAAPELIQRAGRAADRLSVNIELPSERSLLQLAPEKNKQQILTPMHQIRDCILEGTEDGRRFHAAPKFSPGGQSTQLMVGASPESDSRVLNLSSALYGRFGLKRVYYSSYVPLNHDNRLPSLDRPPLQREHRLYQADWLIRLYGFHVSELFDEHRQNLDETLDPKTQWALEHPEFFPIEINRASYERLLRVPGIGLQSARRICASRRISSVREEDLGKIGVVIKRARFFITVNGQYLEGRKWRPGTERATLLDGVKRRTEKRVRAQAHGQLELF